MPTVLDVPPASRGRLRFHLFGVPVEVQPWFWVVTLVLGWSQDFVATIIWVAVVFLSILIHEFGHVTAYKTFGVDGAVLLYSWGGLAIPRREIRGTLPRVVVALAGPMAGFCLAALAVALAIAWGAQVQAGVHTVLIPSLQAVFERADYTDHFYRVVIVNDLLFVNFYWGLMNLLPVSPLDGSHISRALLEKSNPVRWRRPWLLLSAGVAFALAGLGLYARSLYLAIMFLLLGIASLQSLDQGR